MISYFNRSLMKKNIKSHVACLNSIKSQDRSYPYRWIQWLPCYPSHWVAAAWPGSRKIRWRWPVSHWPFSWGVNGDDVLIIGNHWNWVRPFFWTYFLIKHISSLRIYLYIVPNFPKPDEKTCGRNPFILRIQVGQNPVRFSPCLLLLLILLLQIGSSLLPVLTCKKQSQDTVHIQTTVIQQTKLPGLFEFGFHFAQLGLAPGGIVEV